MSPQEDIFFYGNKSYGVAEFRNWAATQLRQLFPSFSNNLVISDNLVYQNHPYFEEEVKDAGVLVVGGGLSTLSLRKKEMEEYDQVWSMNHCFKNKLLMSFCQPNLVVLGVGVNLQDYSLLSFLKEQQPLVGFELHPNWQNFPSKFYDFHQRRESPLFCYSSRIYGQTGVGLRMVHLAAALGASFVSFIGFDGYPAKRGHAFEPGKIKYPSLCNAGNAQDIHKKQYEKQWTLLQFLYPATKFISLDQTNPLHKSLNGV